MRMSFKGKRVKSGNPFDKMMREQCNRPVAAKSAGIVGKWGVTSFKSVRATADTSSGAAPPKVKKFLEEVFKKSSPSERLTCEIVGYRIASLILNIKQV